jgi:PAB-dependent poly(A)-specific ribonuclease subunit 3
MPTPSDISKVSWGGNRVYIPESMATSLGLGAGLGNDTLGLDWASGIGCLPTPQKRTLQAVGLPEPLRQHFHALDIDSLRQMEPDDDRYKEIPTRFNCAFPLDDPTVQRGAGGSFGYPSCLYKVVDQTDSQLYALRRFDNVRSLTASVLKSGQTKWASIRHPSVVTLYSIHMEKGAVFFAHAYHAAAVTLKQRYLDPRSAATNIVTEPLLWRLLAQLMAGIRLVHSRGMAVRSISCSHILLTSGARFRIASVGVVDVLEFESRKTIQDMQIEDLIKLGYVILSLAARGTIGPKTVDTGLALLQQNFSPEMTRLVGALLSGTRTADQICVLVSGKLCEELDFAMAASDALHSNLRCEYENGRTLRLLLKLGLINERPAYALAPSWSETGDRYVLQLFRDYLFHQTDVDGVPSLDLGHVISSLNKLDNGDGEQVLLSSRDGKDLLVVSYAEIRRSVRSYPAPPAAADSARRCMEASVMELVQQSTSARVHRQPLTAGPGEYQPRGGNYYGGPAQQVAEAGWG